jgi:hypothetical protein
LSCYQSVLFRAGFYGQSVVHRDNPHGKRCSLVVPDGWKRALGVFGAKQGFVAGKVNHYMRMPMARRSKHLVRRPHVGKTHFWTLGDLAFGVSGLYVLGNLLGCLAFQPQFCPKFVVTQHGSRG